MTVPTQHWSVDDVCKYISSLELDGFNYSNCLSMFQKEIINGKLFLNLEKDDLNVLGITQFAKRNALYKHIQKLKEKQSLKSTFKHAAPSINIQTNNSNNNSFNSSINTRLTPINMSTPVRVPVPVPVPIKLNQIGPIQSALSTLNISPRIDNHTRLNTFSRLNTNNSTKESTPKYSSLSSNYSPNNKPLSLSNMTPLILPQSLPIITANLSTKPIVNTYMHRNNITNPFTQSPIFGCNFPIGSPQKHMHSSSSRSRTSFSPNFVPNLINATTQIVNNKNKMNKINKTDITSVENQYNLFSLTGIYQGVNSHHKAFVLMTQANIISLNNLYKQFNIRDDNNNNTIRMRNFLHPLQTFNCNIITKKVQHGWILNNNKSKIPFNPLIKFNLNILTDEIVLVYPLIITGHINHINNYRQIWVTSDLQIDAIEEVSSIPSALIGSIISLRLTNISHKSIQSRDASYMIHDPEHSNDHQLYKGLKVEFCLKLSTRTNKHFHNTSNKPVFVQVWNVKPIIK